MALVVQTGTAPVTGANGYVSVADATSYLADRGYAAVTDAQLIRATDELDRAVSWYGDVVDATQTLGWPRLLDTDNDPTTDAVATSQPQCVINAVCEIANGIATGVARLNRQLSSQQVDVLKQSWFKDSSPQLFYGIDLRGLIGAYGKVTADNALNVGMLSRV